MHFNVKNAIFCTKNAIVIAQKINYYNNSETIYKIKRKGNFMRNVILINGDWKFIKSDVAVETAPQAEGMNLNLPYTWNGKDGQDGGDDYYRGTCTFVKTFAKPEFLQSETVYLEFKGVNSSAEVWLNGEKVAAHDGGYSTFRVEIAKYLKEENVLVVKVDNGKTEKVYPQTADFTFYGGIYRDVNLVVLNKNHFDMDFYGAYGLKIDPKVNGSDGELCVTAYITGEGVAKITLLDADGNTVACGKSGEKLTVKNVRLWSGLKDPYLYTVKAELILNGETVDEVTKNIGFRTFKIDPKKGFFLNGESYPLRGVCRHQDRPLIGNAIDKSIHEEDMALIKETGANTIRLAHYQHDDYFYDLCDKEGMVVWAEIPYISRHMPEANADTVNQMKELIYQQYHRASIVVWGVSNEITMFNKHRKDMLNQHYILNDLCHEIDPSRLTTLACYAMCGPFNKVAHITDVVSWNLYLGWYVPFKFLNNLWFGLFHTVYPNRCIGMSEYGAEGMPNLHAVNPRRGDNTEEYQAEYHEYMLNFFEKRPYLWATHVWNMFDFAADARNQGGEPGMNHKGLVTFDRKTKKDAFYLYKAYWSESPFIHLCGKRFVNRTGKKIKVTVYTNQTEVELYNNGKLIAKKTGKRVFRFTVPMEKENELVVKSGSLSDSGKVVFVKQKDPAYSIIKDKNKNWQK